MVIDRLNAAAIEAKTSETVLWEIEAYYMPLIERLAFENWYKMNNETHFIDDCYRKIRYAVKSFDINKGNFDNRVKTLIYQSLRQYCGDRGSRRRVLELLGEGIIFSENDINVSVEEKAINTVLEEELYERYCDRKTDTLIVDIILKEDQVENKSEIARRLAVKTGRSFDSARGAVRSSLKRKGVAS
ncbi:hypothetical protein [Bacillus cytotoxicus]|uniref:hypothetical protein n=1 Tax=Bacillus cytotoxicus TaxID=580165 RepID=UPI000863F446|nr:hypothetical protein [Bacillus cytotoxicus]AWC30025.1 hypothetical protein CG483_017830 [Bacillus cytotoxicus]AWC42161.1 hypothetical protein CG480_017830 [Bacillus cytotoxicus]AWC50092.1 hypothetical protein CG478_017830 [Bacillus cytotoxicus]AWC54149.1 hypothetical protein CG477_018030 [Bacillus cytotoxicus]AWC58274.1 hypothetical protein CG476_018055 [Bacillus cytotoxicus]